MFASQDLLALSLSFKLAAVSTIILILLGTPLAWWLANTKSKIKIAIEAAIALPLVLPPTVLGFYLLLAFSTHSAIGGAFQHLGLPSLAFSFSGLVIGSIVYSLPFVVQPLQNAFSQLDKRALECAACLRASPVDTFFSVVIPICKGAFITAAVLGFAHTLGEFGIVLMIGGNIPGETQVASIAIYEHVEALDYSAAHVLSLSLLALSFLLLLLVFFVNRRWTITR